MYVGFLGKASKIKANRLIRNIRPIFRVAVVIVFYSLVPSSKSYQDPFSRIVMLVRVRSETDYVTLHESLLKQLHLKRIRGYFT